VTGEELQLSVCPHDTVIEIKLMVDATAGIHPSLQRYVLAGRTLEDGRELRDYNVDQMSKPLIYLLVRKQAKVMDPDGQVQSAGTQAESIKHAALEANARFEHLQQELKVKKGFQIQAMEGDGNCMFRAVALQVWGDQEEHAQVRKSCMDHMEACRDYYKDFIDSEDFSQYIARKRSDRVHGNNPELQAISEIYNRPVEVYIDGADPSNTLDPGGTERNAPLRLSYHENCHYNAVLDPQNPTVGVGVLSCLGDFEPGLAQRQQDAQVDAMTTEEQLTQQVVEASKAEYDADFEKALALSRDSSDRILDADLNEVMTRSRAEAGFLDEEAELQRILAESKQGFTYPDEEAELQRVLAESMSSSN